MLGCELSIAAVRACSVQTVDCLGLQCLMWPHPLSLLWVAPHQQSLHPAPETSTLKNTGMLGEEAWKTVLFQCFISISSLSLCLVRPHTGGGKLSTMSFAYEIGEHGYSQLTVYCYKLCLEVMSRLHCIHKPLYMSSKVVVSNLGVGGRDVPCIPYPWICP